MKRNNSNNPKVGIVILNWNDYENTRNCLKSIKTVKYNNLFIVVVDNGSKDGSIERLMMEFVDIQWIVNKKNKGFAAGNNDGIRFSLQENVDYIFLLNNDTVIIEDQIFSELVDFMEKTPSVGLIGPRLVYPNGKHQISTWKMISPDNTFFLFKTARRLLSIIMPRHTLNKENAITNTTTFMEVGYVHGAAMLFRVSALKDSGFLDEDFFFGAEDADIAFRIHKNNWKVLFYPLVSLMHIGGESIKSRPERFLQSYYVARLMFFSKHYSKIALLFWRLDMLIEGIIKFLICPLRPLLGLSFSLLPQKCYANLIKVALFYKV